MTARAIKPYTHDKCHMTLNRQSKQTPTRAKPLVVAIYESADPEFISPT